MIGEAHLVEVHVLDAIVFKDALLPYQLGQVEVIEEARLSEGEEGHVVQGRLVALIVRH